MTFAMHLVPALMNHVFLCRGSQVNESSRDNNQRFETKRATEIEMHVQRLAMTQGLALFRTSMIMLDVVKPLDSFVLMLCVHTACCSNLLAHRNEV